MNLIYSISSKNTLSTVEDMICYVLVFEVGLESVFGRLEAIDCFEAMGRRCCADSSWTKQARPKNTLRKDW